jgi:hypothetical protein
MIYSIHALYAVLVTGSSACHGFTQVPGNTGGFYHMVCRHGVLQYNKLPVILYLYHTDIIYCSLSNQEFRCNA